tara:strand:- start:366 stop:1112 length:747 start_codon:yes stop_codon:yes gene_type:complete
LYIYPEINQNSLTCANKLKQTGVRMNKFYEILRNEDYKPFVETKGGGNFSADYVSWAVMHDHLKRNFQYVEYKTHEYQITKDGTTLTLPYMLLPNGTAIVKVTLTLEDNEGDRQTHEECLAVRNFKMSAEAAPDAAQVENTIRRCIAKAGSMLTGFGIELWFGEDIKDLDYRPETLINGQKPKEGYITVDQNVKLDRLSRDPVFKGTDTSTKVKTLINSNPTEEKAQAAIDKLDKKIKELRKKQKEAA